jgi:hypothetical protein
VIIDIEFIPPDPIKVQLIGKLNFIIGEKIHSLFT